MVTLEGTYTSVKDESFVDFLIHLGVESTLAKRLLGTHWTMRLWRDGELWGASFMCREYPHLNTLETMLEGVEKMVTHYMFGGRAKLVFTKSGNGFSTTCDTEKFGKIIWEEKYSEEGCTFTFSGKGKSMTEKWERLSRTDGDYIFKKGDNVEAYLKATGGSRLLKYLDTYKLHFRKKGTTLYVRERFGDICQHYNTLELDVESPYFSLEDKPTDTPTCKVLTTRTGVGMYTMVCKHNSGLVEEWKFSFSDWGCVVLCTEKRTGETCKLLMKRFRDMSGSYQLISMVGFEKFGRAMGVSSESIHSIISDHTTKLVIMDKGDGFIRHQLIRKKHPMDYSFRLNEQFSYYHPLLKEVVKSVGTVNRYTFCLVSKTSRGPLKSVMHFNDDFVTWSVSLPEYHLTTKMVFERKHHIPH